MDKLDILNREEFVQHLRKHILTSILSSDTIVGNTTITRNRLWQLLLL